MNAGEIEAVDARTASAEPEAQGADVADEWPQLTPLELAVCLAGSDRGLSPARTARPR
jgi:hypothetical protein